MKCAIMQPTYLPWLGYFDLIRCVDYFVIYDHVQFEKQSWQQRNKIGTKNGELMLTLPVLHNNGIQRRINDVMIDFSRNIPQKHLKSIQLNYADALNFQIIYPEIEKIYSRKITSLIEFNLEIIEFGKEILGIEKKNILSSSLDIKGQKVEALIDVCHKLNCTSYLSPVGSKTYIEANNIFSKEGIKLSYQDFTHPIYFQNHSNSFKSHLSFIDYLFNVDLNVVAEFGILKNTI